MKQPPCTATKLFIGLFIATLFLFAGCETQLPEEPAAPGELASKNLLGHAISADTYERYAEAISSFSIKPNPVQAQGETAQATISIDDDAVYSTGYYSLDGGEWQQFSLAGNRIAGNWLTGEAQTTINLPAEQIVTGDNNYVVIYSCSLLANAWDCRDRQWQIKDFETLSESCEDGEVSQGRLCNDGEWVSLPDSPTEPNANQGLSINEFPSYAANGDPLIVVGEAARGTTIQAAVELAADITGIRGGPNTLQSIPPGLSVLDSEYQGAQGRDVIVIGSVCDNTVLADLRGNPADCTQHLSAGQIQFELREQEEGTITLVEAYNDEDLLEIMQSGYMASLESATGDVACVELREDYTQVRSMDCMMQEGGGGAGGGYMPGSFEYRPELAHTLNPDQKIMLIEFVDYNSPWVHEIEPSIDELSTDYNFGRANYHLPMLGIHPAAKNIAKVLECAGDQNGGYYWQLHDQIIKNGADMSIETVNSIARSLQGLSAPQLFTCVASQEAEQHIQDHVDYARSLGVNGVPTFIVYNTETKEHVRFTGAQPETLREAFEKVTRPEPEDDSDMVFKPQYVQEELAVGDSLNDAFGEISGEAVFLQPAQVITEESQSKYAQSLYFPQSSLTLVQAENHNDEQGTYLLAKEGVTLFEYGIVFEPALQSDVKSGELEDLTGERVYMLGKDYTIVDSFRGVNILELKLLSGAVRDTLEQGETKTYNVDGKDYLITLISVGSTGASYEAKLRVNGEITDAIERGEQDTLSDGLRVGIEKIIYSQRQHEDDQGSLVTFQLGDDSITLRGGSGGGGSLEVNNEDIQDADLEIDYTAQNDMVRIDAIRYSLALDSAYKSDTYIAPGTTLREYLDEPEGMIGEWDVGYLTTGGTDSMLKPKHLVRVGKNLDLGGKILDPQPATCTANTGFECVKWEASQIAGNLRAQLRLKNAVDTPTIIESIEMRVAGQTHDLCLGEGARSSTANLYPVSCGFEDMPEQMIGNEEEFAYTITYRHEGESTTRTVQGTFVATVEQQQPQSHRKYYAPELEGFMLDGYAAAYETEFDYVHYDQTNEAEYEQRGGPIELTVIANEHREGDMDQAHQQTLDLVQQEGAALTQTRKWHARGEYDGGKLLTWMHGRPATQFIVVANSDEQVAEVELLRALDTAYMELRSSYVGLTSEDWYGEPINLTPPVPGDADNNGELTEKDVYEATRCYRANDCTERQTWKADLDSDGTLGPADASLMVNKINGVDKTPRVAFWQGKVSMHTEDGVWTTDPDGVTGADDTTPDEYCNKWYGQASSTPLEAREYKQELIAAWRDAGNTAAYADTRQSYECVQAQPELIEEDDTDQSDSTDSGGAGGSGGTGGSGDFTLDAR